MKILRNRIESEDRRNRWLIRACAVLIAIDLLHLPVGLASIPRYLQRLTDLTIPVFAAADFNVLTNELVVSRAAERGMSLATFAWYSLGIQLIAALIFTTVSGFVLWRARAHWFGWFTVHVMLFLSSYAFFPLIQVALLLPRVVIELNAVFWPTVILYFFLFPNGRFVPRWMGWPIFLYALAHFLLQLLGVIIVAGLLSADRFELLLTIFGVIVPGVFLVMFASQIYRYGWVSSRLEQAQTRWFLVGVAVLVLLPDVAKVFGSGGLFNSFEWENLSLAVVPITLAIAILRYRLWDIDIIIRRTLQYTILTSMLALIYFGSVVLGQRLAGALTGSPDSTLVLVVSTLLVAALFTPLRRRVQDFIDRRFFRRKYDAAQTLAAFTQAARDETRLEALTPALLQAVQDSLQPEQAWMWLKAREQK